MRFPSCFWHRFVILSCVALPTQSVAEKQITPEVLREINWTIVLTKSWYSVRWNKYATLCAHTSEPYFDDSRYLRPIDSSSWFWPNQVGDNRINYLRWNHS